MTETHNGGRIERVAGFDVGRVMTQGLRRRRLPAALCSDRLGAAGWLEFAFPQAQIGRDDRVPVPDTTTLPWRCVCQIVIDGLHAEQALGTGWLAGPRTVFTAGHNLYSHKLGRRARRVTVMPGRCGDVAPFDYFRSVRFEVHPQWLAHGDARFDLGVVWLDSDVGYDVGWFGFASRPDEALAELIVNTAGYPADKRIGTQWFNAGRISHIGTQSISYGLDTEGGQSGSPIYCVDAKEQRTVLAIHAYGGDAHNVGVRITDDVFDTLSDWVR
ncbi:MAG: serine protease [Burkholderiaceae bacterium]|nr:serine protease [Burkholderiaceae bacterium]